MDVKLIKSWIEAIENEDGVYLSSSSLRTLGMIKREIEKTTAHNSAVIVVEQGSDDGNGAVKNALALVKELSEWSQRYPRSTIYSMTRGPQMDSELIKLEERAKEIARYFWCPTYHWSIRQIEYAVDILFKSEEKLDVLYKQLLQYMTLSVMPEDIMSFLGKKLSGPQAGRIDTSTKKTAFGYRIKHRNGALSIKAYNKSGSVLRIEITINNLSQFRVYREVCGRDGHTVKKLAPLKKSIYSLEHLLNFP